ncbi:molybdopterin-binding tetrapyrrole methyltransferase, one heme-binding site, putative [Syntrophotalea carbinolica DSM 2380]|uniref:Molybdopterin-binding tetrapyrrole methyltransferase, one heme-binding site, putative n=1 Tax=Syntrophotalea carbinolica (strain DSM 2380 / NBRC 103641 / GraBd1) TaxID=338963 RepID=Q3A839_SYNC1|nr:SAM-dependent methyltransferase [Syntrophotalea carbinolica]ABA87453.1 molybdopterin-binding tetrapyrrole methyltransferase, one heme-binding site, putative [Syntrophotalea carbinolica DSM 2380]
MKRFMVTLLTLLALVPALNRSLADVHETASNPVMTITGEVKRPLKLSVEELSRFQSVEIQLNEVDRDGNFHGVYRHQAVPLRTLLDMAEVIKQDQPFEKPIDLAIRVTDTSGKQVVLSWGEIYYSNAAEVAIAFAATPVKPMMTEARCQKCHGPEIYQQSLKQYERPAQLPKLLIRSDFYTDRCLEGVSRIEVIDLYPDLKVERKAKLDSREFRVNGAVAKELKISSLKEYPHMEMQKKVVGVHMGYHGLHRYRGVSLAKILEQADIGNALTKAVVISAPDGYRALFSLGELFLSYQGRRIMLAESDNGKTLDGQRGGKYRIIVPEELVDDRDILAVDRIEVVDLKPTPKISIIGVGPGDTDLITLEAIAALARADVVVAPDDIVKRFATYLGDKPVLFDPLKLIKHMFRKQHPNMDAAEAEKLCTLQREAGVKKIRQALDQGKNVAFLDWGDPMIYGSTRWIRAFFSDEQLETIPALSAFNVANAMIQRDIGAGGSIVISVPSGLKENPQLLAALAKNGDTLAKNGDTLAIFMGLKEFQEMQSLFDRHYPADTPVNLVYSAGIAGSEHLVRTTLKDAVRHLKTEPEKFLGLIYMGPRLNMRFGECN